MPPNPCLFFTSNCFPSPAFSGWVGWLVVLLLFPFRMRATVLIPAPTENHAVPRSSEFW